MKQFGLACFGGNTRDKVEHRRRGVKLGTAPNSPDDWGRQLAAGGSEENLNSAGALSRGCLKVLSYDIFFAYFVLQKFLPLLFTCTFRRSSTGPRRTRQKKSEHHKGAHSFLVDPRRDRFICRLAANGKVLL